MIYIYIYISNANANPPPCQLWKSLSLPPLPDPSPWPGRELKSISLGAGRRKIPSPWGREQDFSPPPGQGEGF